MTSARCYERHKRNTQNKPRREVLLHHVEFLFKIQEHGSFLALLTMLTPIPQTAQSSSYPYPSSSSTDGKMLYRRITATQCTYEWNEVTQHYVLFFCSIWIKCTNKNTTRTFIHLNIHVHNYLFIS